ncbi:MAG: D-hexose-6-phosphate mutarotase, partial [Chloroflexota bacterium]
RLQTVSGYTRFVNYGAHVLDYVPAGHKPVLWVSKDAIFESGKAIRGGIPIIWPWFGAHPNDTGKSSHGIGRRLAWDLLESRDDYAKLQLPLGEQGHSDVDGQVRVTLEVNLGSELVVSLTTENLGAESFWMTAALHSYFSVSDVRQIQIGGLDGRTYIDQLDGNQRKQQVGAISIDQEVDRIYVATSDTVEIHDPAWERVIAIAKSGSMSTVVWNPWIDKSKQMSDFGNEEYLGMVCVETGNVADDARSLAPGESHTLTTKISVRAV